MNSYNNIRRLFFKKKIGEFTVLYNYTSYTLLSSLMHVRPKLNDLHAPIRVLLTYSCQVDIY